MFNSFTTYYELINESQLPPGSFFTDPYDNTTFKIETTDNLDSVATKVSEKRKSRGYPIIREQDLKILITASLVENTPDPIRTRFFKPVAIPVTPGQVISLAKAIVTEMRRQNPSSTIMRQSRAKHCMDCPYHRPSAEAPAPTPTLLDTLGFASLAHAVYYPEEERLGACGMCGCDLKTKVKTHIDSSLAGLTPEHLDLILRFLGAKAFDSCWILKECISHPHTKQILIQKMRNGAVNGEQLLQVYLKSKAEEANNPTT